MLRRIAICLALATTLLAITAVPAFAADWYVESIVGSDLNDGTTPATPFASITRGMLAASSGDTVHVAPGPIGVYNEALSGEVFPIEMESGVVLQGTGADFITIEGNGVDPAIHGEYVDLAGKIDGFTITEGHPGLSFTYSNLTVSNNTITGNSGGYEGGGVHSKSGAVRILDNLISNNSAFFGGGICCEVDDFSHIEGNTIEGNTASMGGGGIECYLRSNPTIVRNTIRNNVGVGGAGGGGILSEAASLPYVSENVIDGNSIEAGGKGGAVYCYSASIKLVNCQITNNVADDYTIAGINSAQTEIVNCTIANNSSGGIGRASTSWPFSATVVNSILRNTGPEIDAGMTAGVTYSDVEGGFLGTGNIDADPLFVDPTVDYHLTASSPCIDTGIEDVRSPIDLEGNPRPYGAAWDMGAYEYSGESNEPPVAEAGGPYLGFEGAPIPLDGSESSDPDNGSGTGIVEWAWDLDDDGEFDDAFGPQVEVTYPDNGVYTGTLRVTDDEDDTDTDTFTVTVENVAPTVDQPTLPIDPLPVLTPVDVSASFTDPSTADTHVATIDWGDGTTSEGSVDEVGGSGTAYGAHVYEASGVYTVTMTVIDDDGGTTSVTSADYIVIYDPSAGFATGHGWFNSPAGAYLADPTLGGRAKFGFVSRYKKGTQVPDGSTKFVLKTGDFEFLSDTQQWLVVNQGGRNAQFKCTGTVNGDFAPGSEPFDCMIWAGDGTGPDGEDTFRIKIWYTDSTDTEVVVYDNMARQPIGAGSIVVQVK